MFQGSKVIRWILIGGALVLVLLIAAVVFLLIQFRRGGIGVPNQVQAAPAPTTIPLQEFVTQNGIHMPPGFMIATFASGLNGPRMLALGPEEGIYVTERGAGRVLRLEDTDGDGTADNQQVVVSGLEAPSGLAFYQDGSLYVAEPGRVLRYIDRQVDGTFGNPQEIISGIPTSGHNTRTLLFSPDGRYLYVSIGSSCNTCNEDDPRRAAIVRYNPDGSGEQLFASGLRNAVGLALRPGTEEIWASNNGSDWLGDDLPPETINILSAGADFGWPRCHAGRIPDPDLGGPQACADVKQPAVEMQAHSAPLGLTFYTGEMFPAQYQGDLYVAFHGSWNRTVPTGYKVVRIPVENGVPGAAQDFVWGWLQEDGSRTGRPVDVLTGPDGALYISDDQGGVIYRVVYSGP